jgi:eukaryotic-like serine/threonine-protein kinase
MVPAETRDHLLLPQRGRPTTSQPASGTGLPADLLGQSAQRLTIVALLYAFVFFMAGFFQPMLTAANRQILFGSLQAWVPGVTAISVALLVAAVVRSGRLPVSAVMIVGLVFEVASSYGIASAEFLDPVRLKDFNGPIGLSWVAVWTLLFTVVVPTRPRRAIVAALASVSAIPVVVAIGTATMAPAFQPDPGQFFFGFIFPYLLVVLMAYVGARVVYGLGTEVTRARELGSYKLIERLGQGGMGEVWRAEHRLLARPAAIKLIRSSAGSDSGVGATADAVRRFELEARAIASLRSPHTVELFDFGVAGDGAFYYVMELLDGFDVDTLVRLDGPLLPERVIHILRQVCHSLSEADSRGLVHRDIKPANIFLCRYGEDYDFVKVLDFGIVKAARNRGDDTALVTMANVIQGTPAFIAPEQALGASDVDSRADIYATGCVAYWLLTGQLVFTADTPLGLVMHHARTPPTAPSTRSEMPIPAALDQLVLDCLAKNPADRPQSARELSRRLGAIHFGQTWSDERAREWWMQHEPPGPTRNF